MPDSLRPEREEGGEGSDVRPSVSRGKNVAGAYHLILRRIRHKMDSGAREVGLLGAGACKI